MKSKRPAKAELTRSDIGWLQSAIQEPGCGVFSPSAHHAEIYQRILEKLSLMFWQKVKPKRWREIVAKAKQIDREIRRTRPI